MAQPSDRFRQTCTYATVTGRTVYNVPTTGSQSTAAARVQAVRQVLSDAAGQPVQASWKVYTTAALTTRERVWLPGANTASVDASKRVIQVDPYVDGEGTTRFYTVWLAP